MSKCAAIQMVSSPNVSSNLIAAEQLIAEAAKAGAKLVALPENFALMGNHERDKLAVKETDGSGPIQAFLARVAKQYAVWVVAGTMPIASENADKVRASCLIYDDQGQRVARYDKIHLFDVDVPGTNEAYRESDSIEAGETDQALIIDTPFGKLGVGICYDLRFPEFFRAMSHEGVDMLIIPAAFTAETGAVHWELLLRARAVENLSYIIAPNQGGFHDNGRRTFGHSMIIDPWGVVLDCYKTGSGFVCADINPERLAKIRSTFPVLTHRRLHCE